MLKKVDAWELYCDGCKERFESGEYTLFGDDSQALDDAEGYDWVVYDLPGDKHYCPDCNPGIGDD